jgi:tetratricopeptide (TPR) repeat protein
VIDAMERVYLKTDGALAERLMAALAAGDAAGGQTTGRESAALLVRTIDGFPMDIDLRVDDSSDPVRELRRLFDMQTARQLVIDANAAARRGEFQRAKALLIAGVARGAGWARVWIRASRVAEEIEEPALALEYIDMAFSENAAWAAAEIGEGSYAELGASADFHRSVTADEVKRAMATYEQVRAAKESKTEERVAAGRKLLEVGRAREAILILNERMEGAEESIELRLVRATAYAAVGDYVNAMVQCEAALKREPKNLRVRMRMAALQREREVAR